MSDVKSKSVKTGLIMVVRERVTNRRVEGSVETPAKVGIAASEERERGRGREGGAVACSALQIHCRLLPLLFPYGISSSPLTEAAIGFLSLYEIRISISELRFSLWFCGLFLIFEDSA